jgi:hypothetical protein
MSTEDEDKRTFEIVEAHIETKNPLPPLVRKRDGFNRQDAVNAFARTFEMIGGVPRMALWADRNPDKFYALYSRLLPSAAVSIGTAGAVIIEHALAPTELDRHPTPKNTDVTDVDTQE